MQWLTIFLLVQWLTLCIYCHRWDKWTFECFLDSTPQSSQKMLPVCQPSWVSWWNCIHTSYGGAKLNCPWWVQFTNSVSNQSAILKPKPQFHMSINFCYIAIFLHIWHDYLSFYVWLVAEGHWYLWKHSCEGVSKVGKFTSWLGTRSASAKHDSSAKPWDIEGLKNRKEIPQKDDVFYWTNYKLLSCVWLKPKPKQRERERVRKNRYYLNQLTLC